MKNHNVHTDTMGTLAKVSALLSQLDELSARLHSRQSTTDALIHQILDGA